MIHYYYTTSKKSSTQVAHLSCTKFSKIHFFCLPQVKKVKKVFLTFPDAVILTTNQMLTYSSILNILILYITRMIQF